MTQPIPEPEVLNPDRVNRDAREHFTVDEHLTRGDMLSKALEESCAYARQLWQTLDLQRTYLMESLPSDPRKPGKRQVSASPTGPDDDAGWEGWIGAFATTTSALCGPQGDSGFGLSEARNEARLRRTAPEMRLHADHPGFDPNPDEPSGDAQAAPAKPAAPAAAPSKPDASSWMTVKGIVAVAVGVLAVRGLLPRHSRVAR